MDLVDDSFTEIDRAGSIIKGFHGLHTFAYAHWLSYLLRLTENGGWLDKTGSGSQLEHAITALCNRYLELSVSITQRSSSNAPGHETEARANVFSMHEPLRALAIDVWEAENTHAEDVNAEGTMQPFVLTNHSVADKS